MGTDLAAATASVNKMPKTIEQYLALPYTKTLQFDPVDEIYVARVQELPGCSAHGNTEIESLTNLRDNMEFWIIDCLDSGDAVPEPDTKLPSGKWLQRVPRTLHKRLIERASREEVSLNQLVTSYIAQGLSESAENHQLPAVQAVAVDSERCERRKNRNQ